MTTAESPIPEPGQLTYNEALGMTFQQYLFRFRIQQRDVAAMLGTSQSVVSRKLRGTVGWTAEDLYEMAAMLGVSMDRLTPTRSVDGSWVPAPYVPGQQKTPALASAGVSVAGEGLEPSTSRL